jgi:hypothetical protein
MECPLTTSVLSDACMLGEVFSSLAGRYALAGSFELSTATLEAERKRACNIFVPYVQRRLQKHSFTIIKKCCHYSLQT